MNLPDNRLVINALGHFTISINGKPILIDWPNEAACVLFCSLLSPLDLYFTWDRLSRSLWGVPASPTIRRRLMVYSVLPLTQFLINVLGFNPLVKGNDGIRIDTSQIQIDAFDFHTAAMEGFKQLSLGNDSAAVDKFAQATELYAGSYLPGMTGKIITNTRKELDALYQSMVLDALPRIQYSHGADRSLNFS